MNKILLKIITPEKIFFNDNVDQVTLPTTEGEITILKGHIPLISLISKGDILIKNDNKEIVFAIVGGFIETKDSEINILADFVDHVENITENEIEKAILRAKELQEKFNKNEITDYETYTAELERNMNKVKISDKWRKKYRI